MTPFPALVGNRLLFVACRFETGQEVLVQGGGPLWPREWGGQAASAVDRAVDAVHVRLAEPTPDSPHAEPAEIEIVMVANARAVVPSGLGDTLSECDVSRTGDEAAPVRGLIARTEIRMRRSQEGLAGRIHVASDAEWIGALIHELGHALGFAGHVTSGESLLVLEESWLRGLGRKAVEKSEIIDPSLAALYSMPPGQKLGERPMSEVGQRNADALLELVSKWEVRWGPPVGPVASVGDRRARIRWYWPEQDQKLELVFPKWRREVAAEKSVTALLGVGTLKSFFAEKRRGEPTRDPGAAAQ